MEALVDTLSKWWPIMENSTTFLGVATTTVTTMLVLTWAYIRIHRKKLRLPPGPRGWPIIGNLNLLGSNPHTSLMALSEKYGPLMYLRLGYKHTVVVSSPAMAQEFLKIHDKVFASRPKSIVGEVLFYGAHDLSFSVLGDHFRAIRKIFVEELFSAKRLGETKDIRREEILNCLERILDESYEGKPVNMGRMVLEMALNNVTRLVFNKTYYGHGQKAANADEASDFHNLSEEWIKIAGAYFIGDYVPFLRKLDVGGFEAQLVKLKNNFRKLLIPIIEEHRRHATTLHSTGDGKKDFLDTLLSLRMTRDDANCDGEEHGQIISFIQDLLLAGTETLSAQMVWTLTELMRHPEVLHKVQEELDEVVGDERMVEESDLELKKLPYLQAVVKESLRLHHVVPLLLPHESVEATKVAGYYIPEKTTLLVNAYAIARDPNVWKNPLDFDPTRFLDNSIDPRGQSFRNLPFGAGRRACPGANMALIILELALALLLHTCRISLPKGMNPLDIDVEEFWGLTLPRKTPLELLVTPRRFCSRESNHFKINTPF